MVLAAGQARADAAGAVAPAPVMIRRSPAALQIALLDALGAAVALMAREEGLARTAARHMADAARRMAKSRLDELGSAAAKVLLGAVRARLGNEVAEAIEEFVRDLGTSVDERLAARITAAGDGDVIEVIAGFAVEVAALAGERDVLLALDSAERLDEDDVRRLADLFAMLPDRVGLRLAYATADESAQECLDELRGAGATVVVLDGLGPDLVARWLADEGIPASTLGETMRVTGGYPFHLQDAVAALKAGLSLTDLQPREMTGLGTRRAFRKLDPEVQRAAIMLAAFTDPPPRERIPGFLKLDTAGWAVVEQRLWDARMFAVEQDQHRWFHEMRRRYLWQEIMTEPQRRDAAEAAVSEVLALMRDTGAVNPALLVEFAGLLPLASGRLAAEPGTRSMVDAGIAEIAVAAAIVELSEPATVRSVHAAPVRCGFRPGSATDGHGIPASFRARVIRAALCPASRWAHNQRTTGAVSGSGSSWCARRPHAACASLGCGPASVSRYPYGGRPPRYRPCSRVWVAIAVRTRILVRAISRLDCSPSASMVCSWSSAPKSIRPPTSGSIAGCRSARTAAPSRRTGRRRRPALILRSRSRPSRGPGGATRAAACGRRGQGRVRL